MHGGNDLSSQEHGVAVSNSLFGNRPRMSIADIEDWVIGFRRDEVKLFMFGRADSKLFAFKTKKKLDESEQAHLLALR